MGRNSFYWTGKSQRAKEAAEVAQVFKDNLENKFKNVFHKVIFAIPQGKDGNYEKFKEVWRQNMKNKNQKHNKK